VNFSPRMLHRKYTWFKKKSRSLVWCIRSWYPCRWLFRFWGPFFTNDYTLVRDACIVKRERERGKERQRERERCRRDGDYYRVNERAVIGCGEPPTPTGHRRSFATFASSEHRSSRSIWKRTRARARARLKERKRERERESICRRVYRVIVGKYDDVATNPAWSGTYFSANPG